MFRCYKMAAHETSNATNAARTCAAGEHEKSCTGQTLEPVVVLRDRARARIKSRGLSSQTIGRGSRPIRFIGLHLERKSLAGTASQYGDSKRFGGQGLSEAQARQTGACRADLNRGRA